ncbi:helix-turn-helix domain-containing protein [Qipengyuania sp.]|uniref:helix-turn-helix domain-containing protein n=1 Tax=Qipengyuania sp. TaxID=2004515 RepID=UPI003BA922D6
MMKEPKKYPNRIRKLRKARNLTQAKLGEAIGVSAAGISQLENGERDLKIHRLRQIAGELNVTPADLLSADDNPYLAAPQARQLLDLYSRADDRSREAILKVAEILAN